MATILDKLTGIFNYGQDTKEENKTDNPNDDVQQRIFDIVWQDYQYFKSSRQQMENMWRKEQRFYRGDHWYGLRPPEVSQQRPNSVDNVVWSQIESITSRLTGWEPTTDFEAQEPGDEKKAELLNEFIPYDLRCIKFHPKHTRAVRRMVIHGPLVYKVVFDPSVQGGRGNNRYMGQNDIIPVDLGSFFPDPRLKDFIYLQKGSANIIHTVASLDYFKQRFGDRGKLVMQDNMSDDVEIFDRDYISQIDFNTGTNQDGTEKSQRSGLIEYWYKGKPKLMTSEDKKLFKELAQEMLGEGKDPSETEAKAKGTVDGIHCIYISTSGVFLEHKSYVYDHGQYPIVARILFPDEDNPWGKGYMRDMMSPQVMLNKFSELAVETIARQGNAAIMYRADAIPKVDNFKRKRSEPGAMLEVSDLEGIKEITGMNVPNTLFEGMNYYKDMLQKIPGQFDSANGQSSADVNSGAQAQALINASSGRLSLPSEIIKDALKEVFEQYIELAAQFYKQERIMRVVGGQTSFSRDAIVSRAPTEYETGNQVPHPQTGEMMDEKLPVAEEYVPHFDIIVNIGAEKPQDRQYWIQTALTLLQTIDPVTQMPMIDAKAVQYTIQNGRMEPMQVIQDRMDIEGKQKQQMEQLQQQSQQDQQEIAILQKQIEMLHGHLDESQQQNTQATADTLKHLNDGQRMDHEQQMQMQQQVHKQQIDKANTLINAAKVVQMGQKQAVSTK